MPPLAFMPLHIERLLCSGQICWVYVSSGSRLDGYCAGLVLLNLSSGFMMPVS